MARSTWPQDLPTVRQNRAEWLNLDEMRNLMGGEIVQHIGWRQFRRHENDKDPAEVHEPQRLDWSRIDTLLTRTPRSSA